MVNFYFHEDFNICELRYIYSVFADCGLKYSPIPTSDLGYFNFSFDDNYKSWLQLGELGFSVTMFLNTLPFETGSDIKSYLDRIDKPYSTSLIDKKDDIKYLLDSGHFFGFHTHSHINIAKSDVDTITREISLNRIYFSELGIDSPVNQLAIPFGMIKYITKYQELCLLNSFNSLIYANPGLLGQSNNQIIHRIEYDSRMSLKNNISRARKITPRIFSTRWLNYDVI